MMLPAPQSRPDWLPLRLVILSVIISVCMVLAGGASLMGAMRMLAESASLAPEPGGWVRAGSTLAMLCATMLIATSTGLAVAILLNGLGKGVLAVAMVAGRFVALVPVAALGWSFVGVWIGRMGMPIETLLPSLLMPRGETPELALGRWTWGWMAPVLLVAVPVTGETLARAAGWLHDADLSREELGLRARGVPLTRIYFHHRLAQWICLLGPQVQALGLVALGYFVVAEQILGLRGWGGWVAEAVLKGDRVQLAASVHIGGWLAAAWCVIASMFGGWKRAKVVKRHAFQHRQPWFQGLAAIPLCVTIMAMLWLVRDDPLIWWRLVYPDVALALAAAVSGSLVALVLTVLPRRFPLLKMMESLGWAPWLLWAAVASSLTSLPSLGIALVLGIATGAIGGWHLRQVRRITLAAYEASIVTGISPGAAWARHVRPMQIQAAVAWLAESFGWLLLTVIVIRYLGASLMEQNSPGLGQNIASSASAVLSTPGDALIPGLVAALCALSFQLMGRIIQPRTLL